jgi:hypothetical protein
MLAPSLCYFCDVVGQFSDQTDCVWAGCPGFNSWQEGEFSVITTSDTHSFQSSGYWTLPWRQSSRSMKLTTQLHVVPNFGMIRALALLLLCTFTFICLTEWQFYLNIVLWIPCALHLFCPLHAFWLVSSELDLTACILLVFVYVCTTQHFITCPVYN